MMDAPDHPRPGNEPRRQSADEIGVVHAGLHDLGPLAAKMADKPCDAAGVGNAGPHAHRHNRNARALQRSGDGQIIDQ